MDELEISGKRYISSRRAAKDNGYTQDYVGQLIRSGKVKGQKVGRAWYVDVQSFEEYLQSESQQSQPVQLEQSEQREQNIKTELEPEPTPSLRSDLDESEPKVEPPDVVPQEEQLAAPIHITIAKEPVQKAPWPGRQYEINSGLRYVEEEETPLPEIERKIRISREEAPAPKTVHSPVRRSKSKVGRVFAFMAGVVLIATVAGATSFVTYKISTEEGKTANVWLSFSFKEYSASFWKFVKDRF